MCRGGGRSGGLSSGASLETPRLDGGLGGLDGKLGFFREYLASAGALKGFSAKSYLSDLNYVLANPRVHRFFSSGAPKKKSKCTFVVLNRSISAETKPVSFFGSCS